MHDQLSHSRGASFGPMLVGGFSAALVAACTWFITHHPWLGLMEQVAIPLVLVAWFVSLAVTSSRVAQSRAISVGIGSGLISGLAGLVFFGSRLGKHAAEGQTSEGMVPDAWMLLLGFVGLGIGLGLVGGLIGRVIARPHTPDQSSAHWLSRFALVVCVAIAPLVFIGGLVTSTRSGMAVPDWPRTFGANMFLYPLGSHSEPGTFVEHSHRLFGAFVGLSAFLMLIWVFAVERRRWVWAIASIAFALVCAQGILGGGRVHFQTSLAGSDPIAAEKVGRWLALAHGVLAQLTFATMVALAVTLSDHFRALTPGQTLLDSPTARRVRLFCTAALHTLLLQLAFGALYRHLRGNHALWTHIGFSIVVVIIAAIAGFTLMSEPVRRTIVGRTVASIGLALATLATVQFLLGWATFALGGRLAVPESIGEALFRTVHQANGAVLIAVAAGAFVWGKRLGRANRASQQPLRSPTATA